MEANPVSCPVDSKERLCEPQPAQCPFVEEAKGTQCSECISLGSVLGILSLEVCLPPVLPAVPKPSGQVSAMRPSNGRSGPSPGTFRGRPRTHCWSLRDGIRICLFVNCDHSDPYYLGQYLDWIHFRTAGFSLGVVPYLHCFREF